MRTLGDDITVTWAASRQKATKAGRGRVASATIPPGGGYVGVRIVGPIMFIAFATITIGAILGCLLSVPRANQHTVLDIHEHFTDTGRCRHKFKMNPHGP